MLVYTPLYTPREAYAGIYTCYTPREAYAGIYTTVVHPGRHMLGIHHLLFRQFYIFLTVWQECAEVAFLHV